MSKAPEYLHDALDQMYEAMYHAGMPSAEATIAVPELLLNMRLSLDLEELEHGEKTGG